METLPDNLRRIPVSETMQPFVSCLAIGQNAELEAQLVAKSRQPHIIESTPNDAEKRFSSSEALHIWQQKGREFHWLLGPEDDLAGVIWYGRKKLNIDMPSLTEIPEETFAIRLYEGYVGHRLATPFMRLSMQTLVKDRLAKGESIPAMWLQTDTSNERATAAYTRFGYKEIDRNESKITMMLTADELRSLVEDR